mmetsp:Transcript_7431/g.22991  ORF Transcript_7431/g.22991 Transcript_7431/m.22991 type:complete len:214 (+) Transcript_7431:1479-2120(+)
MASVRQWRIADALQHRAPLVRGRPSGAARWSPEHHLHGWRLRGDSWSVMRGIDLNLCCGGGFCAAGGSEAAGGGQAAGRSGAGGFPAPRRAGGCRCGSSLCATQSLRRLWQPADGFPELSLGVVGCLRPAAPVERVCAQPQACISIPAVPQVVAALRHANKVHWQDRGVIQVQLLCRGLTLPWVGDWHHANGGARSRRNPLEHSSSQEQHLPL